MRNLKQLERGRVYLDHSLWGYKAEKSWQQDFESASNIASAVKY